MNKRIFITVDEPWDFISHEGQNRLSGSLLNKSIYKGKTVLFFQTVHQETIKGITSNQFCMTPRFTRDSLDQLFDGKEVIANVHIIPSENKDTNPEEMLKRCVFVIIGSITLTE